MRFRKKKRRPSQSAHDLICSSIARTIRVPPRIKPSEWAQKNLVVAGGPQAGHKWSPTLTPYAVEILDCLETGNGVNEVAVRKSAQVGLTELAIAWVGWLIDVEPGTILYAVPTIKAAQDFNSDKLAPALRASPPLAGKVEDTSTVFKKRFPPDCSLTLIGMQSGADVRSKTIQFVVGDEIEEWPQELVGQGDPLKLLAGRQLAFQAEGTWKRLICSSPADKRLSRIEPAFEAGDQRFFQVPCPHCGERQRLEFGKKGAAYGLKFKTEGEPEAYYQCRHCGGSIQEHQKRAMLAKGRWVPANPGAPYPSFHIDALSSNFVTFDDIAREFLAAKDDQLKLKVFVNLYLGEAWEGGGDAPDWQRLYSLRESYPPRAVPEGAAVITAGADVQSYGLYYEVVAWGEARQSWSIDCGFIDGDPRDTDNRCWRRLGEIYDRLYEDAGGGQHQIAAFGIDSGYLTDQTCAWVRRRPNAYALKGVDGEGRAAIAGSPTRVDINSRGKRKRRGAQCWPVGTWTVKAQIHSDLEKKGKREGEGADPEGYCHFSDQIHDENFFKQLTAEYFAEKTVNGVRKLAWEKIREDNHFFDCRVYAAAMRARVVGAGHVHRTRSPTPEARSQPAWPTTTRSEFIYG